MTSWTPPYILPEHIIRDLPTDCDCFPGWALAIDDRGNLLRRRINGTCCHSSCARTGWMLQQKTIETGHFSLIDLINMVIFQGDVDLLESFPNFFSRAKLKSHLLYRKSPLRTGWLHRHRMQIDGHHILLSINDDRK